MRELDEETGDICEAPEWLEGRGVSVETALEMMTINAAHAMDLESDIGSLEVGKIADLIVMHNNPLDQVGDQLLDNSLMATLIDGEVVWCAVGSSDWCDRAGHSSLGSGAVPFEPAPDDVVSDRIAVSSARESAVIADFPVEGAVDGTHDEGGWVSGQDSPQWIELDLGSAVAVERLVLWVDRAPGGHTEHRIYGGPDPDPSEQLAVVAGNTDWGDRLKAEIGRTVRYLPIETVVSPSWVAWLEIEVVPSS